MAKPSGMINVGDKAVTKRSARAQIFISLPADVIDKIKNNKMPKGNVLEAARLAGIMAAKKVDQLIPLCHSLEMNFVGVEFVFHENGLQIEAVAKANAKTGVEMEALTACSIAALTVYDMSKMFTHDLEINNLYLIEKKGGKSGIYKNNIYKKV